jgi:membrane protein YdbS with pleckstrin-like domain
MDQTEPRGAFVERVVGVLVACWCLIPIFVVFGFLFWASIEAPWPWKLLFIAGLLVVFLGFVIWGGSLCRQCRVAREGRGEDDAT